MVIIEYVKIIPCTIVSASLNTIIHHSLMIVMHAWPEITYVYCILSFRRPTALAYLILCTLPCFAILIASSKVMSSWLIIWSLRAEGGTCWRCVLPRLHRGLWKRHICRKYRLFVFGALHLLTEWWSTLLIAPRRKKSFACHRFYSLVSTCTVGDFGTILIKRQREFCSVTRLYSVRAIQ